MLELTPFRRRRDLVGGDFAKEMLRDFFTNEFWPEFDSAIKADIKENNKEYIVEAELPGVNKEQINIELKDSTLTISANMDSVTEDKGENYIRRERRQGSICRSFYVEDVDRTKVKADYTNGLLKIVLPKLKEQALNTYRIKID